MRLIDADKLQEFPIRANRCDKEHANTHFINGTESVMEYAKLLPTVDAVPVVRCEDCEHAERYERADGTAGYYCGHPQNTFTYGEYWDRAFKPAKEPDDFCSYGELKMGGGADDAAG